MAFSLRGERPGVAAISFDPIALVRAWAAAVLARRARKAAVKSLMELDDHLLDDVGVERQDLFEALNQPSAVGSRLAARRAARSRAWLAR